jgi:hypothetical protein
MVWSALAVIGFLVLMALVIALGTVSTGRYEREQRVRTGPALPAGQSILPPRQSIGLPPPRRVHAA